jgi:hypothetical protein
MDSKMRPRSQSVACGSRSPSEAAKLSWLQSSPVREGGSPQDRLAKEWAEAKATNSPATRRRFSLVTPGALPVDVGDMWACLDGESAEAESSEPPRDGSAPSRMYRRRQIGGTSVKPGEFLEAAKMDNLPAEIVRASRAPPRAVPPPARSPLQPIIVRQSSSQGVQLLVLRVPPAAPAARATASPRPPSLPGRSPRRPRRFAGCWRTPPARVPADHVEREPQAIAQRRRTRGADPIRRTRPRLPPRSSSARLLPTSLPCLAPTPLPCSAGDDAPASAPAAHAVGRV